MDSTARPLCGSRIGGCMCPCHDTTATCPTCQHGIDRLLRPEAVHDQFSCVLAELAALRDVQAARDEALARADAAEKRADDMLATARRCAEEDFGVRPADDDGDRCVPAHREGQVALAMLRRIEAAHRGDDHAE